MARNRQPLQVGSRFREAGRDILGNVFNKDWRVEAMWEGIDGRPYVRIVNDKYHTTKTLAENVLRDRSFYEPLTEASVSL
ncbi:hypothetical protein [Radicibacter daui]|uniref:hypothetical protein n=1 Tax=Radicibacter daui TaxID=3064829 RepID=UPI004046CD36